MTVTAPPPDQPALRRRRPRWRLSGLSVVIAAIALVGVLVMLYPAAASWFSDLLQSRQVSSYTSEVTSIGPDVRDAAIDEAVAYNASLTGGALVAANERIPQASTAHKPGDFDYAKLLHADDYGLMARIQIPSIGVDLPVYHGTSDETLAKGVGHLEGTALPVGGIGTHAVLTGHRGLASATLFTDLDKVKIGDTFTIAVFGEVLTYRVANTQVVDPDQTQSLNPVPGKDLVTLVTCTPLGINSQRILVTGERVTPTPVHDVEAAQAPPAGPGFPWWALVLAAVLVALGLYIWLSGRPSRAQRRQGPDAPAPTS
ncbi:class C sortase [Microbacterium luticocti]|uniref:class C sortase n=1 Tax=Microbacterium luticocti TaxID=451764 RepID=UPI000401F920|nr:class C sortase [Microbacterium luticocti]